MNSIMSTISGFASDCVRGSKQLGVRKIFLGACTAAAVAAYYLYSAQPVVSQVPLGIVPQSSREYDTNLWRRELSAEQISFLDQHQSEIDEMNQLKDSVGEWRLLGVGVSKEAYEHEDFSGMLLKIANNNKEGHRGLLPEDDIKAHYNYLEEARSVAEHLNRIKIPKSYLYQTSTGLALIEEKLTFMSRLEVLIKVQDFAEVSKQFDEFISRTQICDINLDVFHNAGFVEDGDNETKIGVIDFDCKGASGTDMPKPQPNYVIGPALLGAAALAAKKICAIPAKVVLGVGGGLGALCGAMMIQDPPKSIPHAHVFAVAVAVANVAMAATAAISTAGVLSYSFVKKGLSALSRQLKSD